MPLGPFDLGLLALSFLAPFLLLVLVMPWYTRFLARRGRVADDVHKQPPRKVPSPAGPVIFVAALAGELVAYAAYGSAVPLAVIGVIAVSFAVGIWDDLSVLGGLTKPLLLLLAAAPLVFSTAVQPDMYDPRLFLPIFGPTGEHFTIYTLLVIAAFPIVANAFNMMDSFNGEVSGFTLLVSLALTFGVAVHTVAVAGFSPVRVASTLPLLAVSAGFYLFNRYPSRAFDGDSGSLVFGAMFAALAITDGVEVAAVVAVIPAILNSFYVLSSVRGFVERRKMGARPTSMGEDGMLHAAVDPSAPTTLARLVLLGGALGERRLVGEILQLTALTCLLSAITSLLTWVI